MRILLVYPGHAFSTVDVAIGYEAALRELGQEVLAFNYHNSLSYHMVALTEWSKRNPSFTFSKWDLLKIACESLVVQAVEFVPDVCLIVGGFALHPVTPKLIGGRLNVPIALLLTESPYLDKDQADMAKHVPLVFTNERNSLEWLRKHNEHTFYLPHSFNPAVHHPQEVNGDYETDVLFWGTMYPERAEVFNAVDWSGVNARIEGCKLVDGTAENAIDNGELAKFYCGTKIALNPHRTIIGVDIDAKETTHIGKFDAWSLGPRTYEIAGCGAFQIADDSRGELREVFGDSVETFAGPEELEEKVRYYLSHSKQREAKAEEARERVQQCAFVERAREILVPEIMRRC